MHLVQREACFMKCQRSANMPPVCLMSRSEKQGILLMPCHSKALIFFALWKYLDFKDTQVFGLPRFSRCCLSNVLTYHDLQDREVFRYQSVAPVQVAPRGLKVSWTSESRTLSFSFISSGSVQFQDYIRFHFCLWRFLIFISVLVRFFTFSVRFPTSENLCNSL